MKHHFEGAGKLIGDKDLEVEGKLDKAKGSAHNVAGDVKTPLATLRTP